MENGTISKIFLTKDILLKAKMLINIPHCPKHPVKATMRLYKSYLTWEPIQTHKMTKAVPLSFGLRTMDMKALCKNSWIMVQTHDLQQVLRPHMMLLKPTRCGSCWRTGTFP